MTALLASMLPSLLTGAGYGLASGGLLGTTDRSNSTGSSRFDTSQIPAFNEALQGSNQSAQQLMALLQQLGGQRTQALQSNLDNQWNAAQGYGQQALQDINRHYNSAQGGVGQGLASHGLYNSTVAPGMQALVNRERNSALGQENDRQRQFFSGLMGQRAQLLDQSLAQQNAGIAGVGAQQYGLANLLPQAIASSRVSTDQQVQRKGGFLSRLFG